MGKIHQAIRRAEQEARLLSRKAEAQGQNPDSRYLRTIAPHPVMYMDVSRPHLVQGTPMTASTPEVEHGAFVDLRPSPTVVAISAPKSFAGQQYGILKRKLCSIKEERDLGTILITSASTSEGKTLTAVNLAFTIAQGIDQRVLLVDANLKRPHVESLLGFSAAKGLADYLSGKTSNEEIILRTRVSNLSIASSGHVAEDPTGLLNGQAMTDFLAYTRERFDWVILDSPPLSPLAEVDLLSSLVDGILIVVRHSHTPLDLISKSMQVLSGRKLLGCLFNGVPVPDKDLSREKTPRRRTVTS